MSLPSSPPPPLPGEIPRALAIAGSDSGGGAGIQADLKAFGVCRVHGMTALTAITAQNTVGLSAIHQVPPEMILAQVRAVATDIGVDAVKIGMLGDVPTIEAVAQALAELPAATSIVLDPVMVSESGAPLLEPAARRTLIELLLPRATIITPNLPEARALLQERSGGGSSSRPGDLTPDVAALSVAEIARRLHALGPAAVVLTGGHCRHATDTFFDGEQLIEIPGERFPGGAAHGSGCTHSSVLAARLAWGDEPLPAARAAKQLAARAVRDGLTSIGAGAGPVHVLGSAL
jgi:hydroxymethylpyrimidine/phosphomethylpyrimidine kinase